MKQVKILAIATLIALGLTCGCTQLGFEQQVPQKTAEMKANEELRKAELAQRAIAEAMENDKVRLNYPIRDSISIQVVLESQKAYDNIQLGLSILDNARADEDVPEMENPKFFPKYFSMVNINLDDGLLYISNAEAANFARVMYLEYQQKVITPLYKRKLGGAKVLSGK